MSDQNHLITADGLEAEACCYRAKLGPALVVEISNRRGPETGWRWEIILSLPSELEQTLVISDKAKGTAAAALEAAREWAERELGVKVERAAQGTEG